ncbi:Zinc finger, C2H2 type [Rhizina undulata]
MSFGNNNGSPLYSRNPIINSPPGLRRSSTSSTISWTTIDSNTIPTPTTPRTERTPPAYGKSFAQAFMELDSQVHHTNSIAPNLLSLNIHNSAQSPIDIGPAGVHHGLQQRYPSQQANPSELVNHPQPTRNQIFENALSYNTTGDNENVYLEHGMPVAQRSTAFSSPSLTYTATHPLHEPRLCSSPYNLGSASSNISSPALHHTEHAFYDSFTKSNYAIPKYNPRENFFAYSHAYFSAQASATRRNAATEALQCLIPTEYDTFSNDGSPCGSSPPPDYHASQNDSQAPLHLTMGTPHRRRAPRRSAKVFPLVISKNDKPHGCPFTGCESRFRRQEHLRRHERTHTTDRPYACKVEGCHKRFARSDNLRTHIRTHTKQGGRNRYVPGLEMV